MRVDRQYEKFKFGKVFLMKSFNKLIRQQYLIIINKIDAIFIYFFPVLFLELYFIRIRYLYDLLLDGYFLN